MILNDLVKTKLYSYDIIVKSPSHIILDESEEAQDRDELMPFLYCEVLDIDVNIQAESLPIVTIIISVNYNILIPIKELEKIMTEKH